MNSERIIVVGGGLAGLTAAALLARGGKQVLLLEAAGATGGRAATRRIDGFDFNLGPRALYRAGAAMRILTDLGIVVHGGVPLPETSYGIAADRIHELPRGLFSLLKTPLLDTAGKWEMMRFLARLGNGNALPDITEQEWLDANIQSAGARNLIASFFRLSTYGNDPARQSVRASMKQVQLARKANVMYLDHGWQSLIDSLQDMAVEHGVEIRTGAAVEKVEHYGSVQGVLLSNGVCEQAPAVVLAMDPLRATSLLENAPTEWLSSKPARMACLDIALQRLPQPGRVFAIGLDRPFYYSVHSQWAALAPEGRVLVHAGKYLPTGDDGSNAERELEESLDLLQPGWQKEVIYRRFLPHMIVSNGIMEANGHKRPNAEVPLVRNLYVAGDWVGPEGLLADAAVASAAQAVSLILKNKPDMLAA